MAVQATITQLQPCQQGKMVRVYVDDEFLAEVSPRLIEELDLIVGQRLLPEVQAKIRKTAGSLAARQVAVKALGRRARTRLDLQQILERKDFGETAITEALDWLTEHGYINDEHYAHERLAALQRRGLGSQGILYTLRREGISEELAAEVVGQQADTLQETERACELARQQISRWAAVPWLKQRRRLYAFLVRRGFGEESIREALACIEPSADSSDLIEEA